jgi:hypothetical protein
MRLKILSEKGCVAGFLFIAIGWGYASLRDESPVRR